MKKFEFISDDAFYIWNRCFCFHGEVNFGEISTHEDVMIETKKGPLYAKVDLIVNLSDHKIIETSITEKRIAIGLYKFSRSELNNIDKKFDPDVDNEPPTTEFIGVEYPIRIQNSNRVKSNPSQQKDNNSFWQQVKRIFSQ